MHFLFYELFLTDFCLKMGGTFRNRLLVSNPSSLLEHNYLMIINPQFRVDL